MDDLISRQAAIDALLNHYEVGNTAQNETMDECVLLVRKLPSAQGGKTMTVKKLIEELEIQHEAWGKQYTFDMILRDIEKYAEEEDHEADKGDR